MAAVKALQQWCKIQCEGYRDVNITNMTTSFRDGLAFCALIHKHRPELIDFDSLSKENVYENNHLAFRVAEEELSIPALLDAEDMVALRIPDRLSILTYVSQYYNYFHGRSPIGGLAGVKRPAEEPIDRMSGTKNQPVMAKTKNQPVVAKTKNQPVVAKTFGSPKPHTDTKRDVPVERTDNSRTINRGCSICNKHVHLVQRHLVDGKLYHRNCFKCSECSNILLSGTYTSGKEPNTFICKSHQNTHKVLPTQVTSHPHQTTKDITGKGKDSAQPSLGPRWLVNKNDDFSASTPAWKSAPTSASTPVSTPAGKPASTPTATHASTAASTPAFKAASTAASTPAFKAASTAASTPVLKDSSTAASTPTWKPALKPGSTPATMPASTAVSTPAFKPASMPDPTPALTPVWKPALKPGLTPATTPSSTAALSPAWKPASKPGLTPATTTPSSTAASTPAWKPASTPAWKFASTPSSTPASIPTPTPTLCSQPTTPTTKSPTDWKGRMEMPEEPSRSSSVLRNMEARQRFFDSGSSPIKSVSATKGSTPTPANDKPLAGGTGTSGGTGKSKLQDNDLKTEKENDGNKEKAKSVISRFVSDESKNNSPLSQHGGVRANAKSEVSPLPATSRAPGTKVLLKPPPMDIDLSNNSFPVKTSSWLRPREKSPTREANTANAQPSENKESNTTPSDWRSLLKPVTKNTRTRSSQNSTMTSDTKASTTEPQPSESHVKTSSPLSPLSTNSIAANTPLTGVVEHKTTPSSGSDTESSSSHLNSSSLTHTLKPLKPDYIPPEEILKELKEIEVKLNELQKTGVELEKQLRQCEEEEQEDVLMNDLMVEWFNLIRNKQLYIRRESELVYVGRSQDLEKEQPTVEAELRKLMDKPERLKTSWDKKREEELMTKLMEIINDRNAIVDGLDEDRLREVEEDEQLNRMMQDLDTKKEKKKRLSVSSWFSRKNKRETAES